MRVNFSFLALFGLSAVQGAGLEARDEKFFLDGEEIRLWLVARLAGDPAEGGHRDDQQVPPGGLTRCRPPGHWAEPGIARSDPAKALFHPP